jgi:cytochrome c biogenesis protein CcmG/thiol:disulfide interchange protein DsbE
MRRVLSPIPLAAIAGVVVLLGLLGYGLAARDPDTGIDDALARGERAAAPALDLPRLSGDGRLTLGELRGRVVVVNFWASWCDPCRVESPLLQRWHERMRARGGTVLGVDVNDVSSDARAFIRRYGMTYPQVRDRDEESRSEWGVIGFPETFVVDRRGRVAAIARGPVDDRFMRERVEPLLRERA